MGALEAMEEVTADRRRNNRSSRSNSNNRINNRSNSKDNIREVVIGAGTTTTISEPTTKTSR